VAYLKVQFYHLHELKKHEEPQDSRLPGAESNTGRLEYEAGMLATTPRFGEPRRIWNLRN
jgi:hypothetical protein